MVKLTTMTKQIRNKYCCNSSDKVPTTECDNYQQTEIAIWPPKPEVLIYCVPKKTVVMNFGNNFGKNFLNRLRFDKVIAKVRDHSFFWDTVELR